MKDDANKEARFSTMIDLYALPADYPRVEGGGEKSKPLDRVLELEKPWLRNSATVGSSRPSNFIEFEALLYCDLTQIQSRIEDCRQAIAQLRHEVASFNCPEDINEGETTAPSKRLIRHLPRYETLKVRVGAPAANAIGLPTLREKCPHFGRWLTRLEKLKETL